MLEQWTKAQLPPLLVLTYTHFTVMKQWTKAQLPPLLVFTYTRFYSVGTMDQSSAATSFGVHLHPFLQCWNNGPKLSCHLFWCSLTPVFTVLDNGPKLSCNLFWCSLTPIFTVLEQWTKAQLPPLLVLTYTHFYSVRTMDQNSAATPFGVHLHPFFSVGTMDQSSAAILFGVHLHPFLQCWNNGPKLSCHLFWCSLTPIFTVLEQWTKAQLQPLLVFTYTHFYSVGTMDQSSAATSFGVHLHPFLQCWNNGPKLSCHLFWCSLTPIFTVLEQWTKAQLPPLLVFTYTHFYSVGTMS